MISQKPTGMPNKQKVIGIVIAVALLIVLWQIIGLFSGSKSSAPTPAPVDSNRTAGARSVTVAQTQATVPNGGAVTPHATPQPQVVEAAVPRDNELLKMQQEVQQKYIDSLNELQMLRIKKEIAEASEAIATAKLATVKAEKNVSDLLTQPAPPPIVDNSTPGGLAAGQQNSLSGFPMGGSPAQYIVISVAMESNRWTAVIGSQGKMYSVGVGDILPDDNSVVSKIGRDGVILEKDGEKRKISITSEI